MMEYVKIENNSSLVRDITSGAIINTNTVEYNNYLNRVNAQNKMNDVIFNSVEEIHGLKTEINSIKENINDIKSMLLSLMDKGK